MKNSTTNKLNEIAIKNQVCQLITDSFLIGQLDMSPADHHFIRIVSRQLKPVNKRQAGKLAELIGRVLIG